jgi:hypothetical protein
MISDQELIDALLVVLKAARDDEFAAWNGALVDYARGIVSARTEDAIERVAALADAAP